MIYGRTDFGLCIDTQTKISSIINGKPRLSRVDTVLYINHLYIIS